MTGELFTFEGKRKYLNAEEQGRFISAANAHKRTYSVFNTGYEALVSHKCIVEHPKRWDERVATLGCLSKGPDYIIGPPIQIIRTTISRTNKTTSIFAKSSKYFEAEFSALYKRTNNLKINWFC